MTKRPESAMTFEVPAERRAGDEPLTPETMTNSSTIETSRDGQTTQGFERTLARCTAIRAPTTRRCSRELVARAMTPT
jgi:hypothetical protein